MSMLFRRHRKAWEERDLQHNVDKEESKHDDSKKQEQNKKAEDKPKGGKSSKK